MRPKDPVLGRLQRECGYAFKVYIEVSREACELLRDLDDVPVPEERRNAIFAVRKQEMIAHQAYTRARQKLWKFLTGEPEE